MQHIRKRTLLDNLDKQQRSHSGRIGRTIYLALLAGFFLLIAYYLAGNLVLLSADGIVLNEKRVVAASYPATITKVMVSEGDVVKKGELLVQLESFEMVKEIADLSVRSSELVVKETELQGQSTTISTLLPLAQRASRESGETVARLDTVAKRGLIPMRARDDAVSTSFQAAQRLAELTAQGLDNQAQVRMVQASRQVAESAVAKLKEIYEDGNIRALDTGVVGSRVPVSGQFVRPGDELLQINGGRSYILAYLPDEYLFPVTAGMKVDVSAGSERTKGTVERVLQIADALPAEFQNMLRPRDRSRLIRVALPEGNPFAVSQKVVIRGCILGWCWVK
ncbi:HlyD family secretion protein [Aminobacter aganoensis]|uniref:Multidrug resistance efflux pump n=1 Tax=Aminobacter aganoensis TaxID=83264 RepID=A0A7X0KKI6_9HYPH|nr:MULTISPECIES: HlyD family efflux transporter periplasmic adaptor subunit [Aminobacter]KQU64376.1 multidrug transporter [Aminobacter sp. DSM 101952]MBB6354058.1 multidrug resistance efflux pump [Aminobacter aganoensis]